MKWDFDPAAERFDSTHGLKNARLPLPALLHRKVTSTKVLIPTVAGTASTAPMIQIRPLQF